MNERVFDLADVKDTHSKITKLPDYQMIKRRFFELGKPIRDGKYSITKFYEDVILPLTPPEINITYNETRIWANRMLPHVERLVGMINANQEATQQLTLLEREQNKITQQFEIRQDVTDLMHQYIRQLKAYIEDPELASKLSHKEYLQLYSIIREEEDRAKGLSLKERSENRADAMFAWMVSQAKAGQLSAEDLQFLEDDVRRDLTIFKQDNGIYQLPVGAIPKIKSTTENTPA